MTLAPRDGRRLKIAIVKLSSLGDVIHALPVARALRQAYPVAHLTWIVEAREYAILRDHPDLDAVLPVDTRLWRRLIRRPAGARLVWQKLGRLQTRIRASRFDVTLDVQGLIKSGLLTAYTGAPLRVGFSPSWCGEWPNCLFTNRHVTPPPGAVHVVEQYLAILEPLGVVDADTGALVASLPGVTDIAPIGRGDMLALTSTFAPGTHGALFRVSKGSARKLADLQQYEVENDPAGDGTAEGSDPFDLARMAGGKTLIADAAGNDLLVANDTGPLHLAAALGTSCLGLYGPTPARRNRPYGRRCRGLQSPDGTMAGLDPAVAFDAALSILDERGRVS